MLRATKVKVDAYVLYAVVFAAGLFFSAPLAIAKSCDEKMTEEASRGLQSKLDWSALHRYYLRFLACDDGGIADDVTEHVVNMLHAHWGELGKLAIETSSDANFEKYILSHIDSTADTKQLRRVQDLSSKECAVNLKALCKKIAVAAKSALE
ncbi:hypothetical protein ACLBXJ_23350 [Methylobacterium mesophilicum]